MLYFSKIYYIHYNTSFCVSIYKCSDRALRLYISDIGLGRWVIIIHETVCRQWFGRAWVVWAVSWVARSDSRLYRWRPPEVTRDR